MCSTYTYSGKTTPESDDVVTLIKRSTPVHSGRCLGANVKTNIQFQSGKPPSTRGVCLYCILLPLVDLSEVMWGPSRYLGRLTEQVRTGCLLILMLFTPLAEVTP